MRSTYRVLIAASVFAVASLSWAQDSNPTPVAMPTAAVQPTPEAQESALPAVPLTESAPAPEVTPVPAEGGRDLRGSSR